MSVAKRSLEKNGESIRIGGRALDVLIALVERPSEIVTQREIIDRVWPDVTVAESGLRVHINALRRALGDGQDGARYITNVAGRGYCFVAPVSRGPPAMIAYPTGPRLSPKPVPPPLSRRVFGRDAVIRLIADDLLVHRFITIVGPGGIGKTTVAAGVGHALIATFDGYIAFADLGMITDPELVIPTVRAALQLPQSTDPMAGLIEALSKDQILLVLDSCEHVIGPVAALAERLFQTSPGTFLLATSREPMHVDGERLFHLSPLTCPPDRKRLTAAEALHYPAVQLFVERIRSVQRGFSLFDEDAHVAAMICRRVDGIALAIELAAGRVGAYGLREVSALLDGQIQLLWQGRRTAQPRQQTLNATLEWSFQLLNEAERQILCRLAVFIGGFTLDAARAVAVDENCNASEAVELIGSLVDKSLVVADLTGSTPVYRLLDVTRQYAMSKMAGGQGWHGLARRHARFCASLLEKRSAFSDRAEFDDQLASPLDKIANIRAALAWCYSAEGDIGTGLSLTSAACEIFLAKGLVQECRFWAETAISRLEEENRGGALELRLQTALATSMQFGTQQSRTMAFDRSIAIASELNEQQQRLTLLYFRLVDQAIFGKPAIALDAALSTRKTIDKHGDPLQTFLSDATLACIYSYIGSDELAKCHFNAGAEFLDLHPRDARAKIDDRLIFRFLSSEATNAFLCGFPDQADELARKLTERMGGSEDYILWSTATYTISFVFKWRHDWRMVAKLIETFSLKFGDQAKDMQSLLFSALAADRNIATGDVLRGVQSLEAIYYELPGDSPIRFIAYAPLARGLTYLGRYVDALSILDTALDEELKLGGSGFRSEFLLLKGETLKQMPGAQPCAAEETLRLALEAARRQTSLSRELNAATSLAALMASEGRVDEGIKLLDPVYGRFTEGFDTIDLTAAKSVLDRLRYREPTNGAAYVSPSDALTPPDVSALSSRRVPSL